MYGMNEYLNSIGEAFVEFAGPMLLQSSILIVALLCLDILLRRRVRAVVRYCVWMLVLIKLFLPATLSSPTGVAYWLAGLIPQIEHEQAVIKAPPTVENATTSSFSHVNTVMPPAVTQNMVEPIVVEPTAGHVPLAVSAEAMTWQAMVFVAWLLVVMSMLMLLIQRTFLVKGLVRQSKVADESLTNLFDQCREQMRMRAEPVLRISPNVTAPSVCGIFRSVVLLPKQFKQTLRSQHMRAVLLHELAHIKRRDLWVSFVQTLLQIVYFYNPLLWVANLSIRKAREQAVDETVMVAMGDEGADYPQVLVDVFRFAYRRPTLSLSMTGVVESRRSLAARIRHMLSRPFPKSAKLGFAGAAIMLLAGLILLPMGAADAEIADGEGDVQAEITMLQALNKEVESLLVPANGTLRHAVEKRYGKGMAVNSADDPTEVDNPASTYRLYDFFDMYWRFESSEKPALLICYDSETLSEVQWARYIEPRLLRQQPESLTDEEKLEQLKLRKDQMESLFFEHTKRFGQDQQITYGQASDNVMVRIRPDAMKWPKACCDPSFQFDIDNKSDRTLFVAYPQSFKVEVDGRWYTSNYTASGEPRSIDPDGRMTFSVSLGDFLSGAVEQLSLGKHTVRVALHHIGEIDASANEKAPIRFGARKFEVVSNALEIEVVPQLDEDTAWGQTVRGVRMRLHSPKRKWSQGSKPKLLVDLHNQGERDLRLAIESESWEIEVDGKWRKPSVFYSGIRRYLPLATGQRQLNVEVWTDSKIGLDRLTPGRYSLRVARIVPSAIESPIKEQLRVISNQIEIDVLPGTKHHVLWSEPVKGVSLRLHNEKNIWKYGQTPKISLDVRNEGNSDIPFDESKHLLQLQVNGNWHKLFYPKNRNRWGIKTKVLRAGQTYEGIEINCGGHWQTVRGTLNLRRLGEGGHILRVAYLGPDGMRAESPPVRIDVVHPMFDPATKGGQRLIGERFSVQDVVAYHKGLTGETLTLEQLKELYFNIAMVYWAKAFPSDSLGERLKAIQGYEGKVLAESYKDEAPYVFLAGAERALAFDHEQGVQLKLYNCLRDAWYYPNPARAAEVRLAALRCLLKYDDLPAGPPEPPVAMPVPNVIGPAVSEGDEGYMKKYKRSVAKLEEHRRIMELLHLRDLYTNDVIGSYRYYLERTDKSLVPEVLGNLYRMAVRYLGNEEVAAQFVEAVKGTGPAPAVVRPKTAPESEQKATISSAEPPVGVEGDAVDFSE